MGRTIETYRRRLQDPKRARDYAARFERGEHKRIDQREQRAVRRIFAGLKDCHTVLDVPSGAGRFVGPLNEGGRLVFELDAAFEVLEFAQARAQKAGAYAGFAQADASCLPISTGSVDAVFCNRLLHHLTRLEERAVVLRELYRVARRYVVLSFFDYRGFGALRKLLKRVRGRKPDYEGQPTLEEFSKEVTECGFRLKEVVPTGGPWVAQKYFLLEKA